MVDLLDRAAGEARRPSSRGRRRSRESCSMRLGQTYWGLGLPKKPSGRRTRLAIDALRERRSAPTTPTRSQPQQPRRAYGPPAATPRRSRCTRRRSS